MTKNLRVVAILAVAAIPWAGAPGRCGEPAPVSRPRTDLYGDPLPPGALARMGTIRYARGDPLDGPPVLAPDHKTFATVSRYTPYGPGRVVCLWDAATGKELRHFDDPDFEPFQVFFLKSENLLGTWSAARGPVKGENAYAMQLWDPATGKKAAATLRDPTNPFERWALSPDEEYVAGVALTLRVMVCDRKTGKAVAVGRHTVTRVRQLTFSPDGKTLAICCGDLIRLWGWKGASKDRELSDFQGDGVERIWFSPNGKWLAAAIYKEGLRVWDTEELKEVRRLPGVHDIRFFPDGKRLICLDTGVVRDVVSGKQLGQLEDCADCLALDISEDSKEVMGYAGGRVRLWDAETGKDRSPAVPTGLPIMIHQIGFLPGGKEVISASPDGAVRAWDAATGKEQRTLAPGKEWDPQKTPPTFMRVAPDGTIIVARRGRLSFFKGVGTAAEVRLSFFPGTDSLNLSPDGKTLIMMVRFHDDTLIEVWDVAERKAVTRSSVPEGPFWATAAVANDRRIAAWVNGSLCLVDDAGSVSRTLVNLLAKGTADVSYFQGVQALNFSPDGNLLACKPLHGGGLDVLDGLTGKHRFALPRRNTDELCNVVFSPDGRMIAAEGEEGVVDIYETSTGSLRRRFRGHRSYQTTLAFSSDGARLATGNRDATILIWDVFRKYADDADDCAPTEGELDALWSRLLYQDAEQACWAMGRLMRHSDESGPYLKRRLLGRKGPEAARIKGRIADLDSDDFDTREAASAELAKWLAAAAPLLKERLADNPSPESRRRMEELLARWERHELPPETIRDLRALEVLESFGAASADAARELAEGDYDASVAAAAKAVLKRLTAK